MKKLKRFAAILLAFAMVIPLTSCFGGGKNESDEKQVVTHVYKRTMYDLPEGMNYVEKLFKTDGGFLAMGSFNETDKATGNYNWYNALVTLDNDFNVVRKTKIDEIDLGEEYNQGSYIQNMIPTSDGFIAAVNASYYDPENDYYESNNFLVKLDPDMKPLLKKSTNELFEIEKGGYGYVGTMLEDGDGNFVVLSNSTILTIDNELNVVNKKTFTEEEGINYLNQVISTESGLLVVYNDSDYNQKYALYDRAAGKLGEPFSLGGNSYYQFYPGNGEYDLFYNSNTGIFGFKIAEALADTAGSYTGEEVFNFMNSDIQNFYSDALISLDNDTFVASGNDDSTDEYKSVFFKFTKVPDSEIKPKYLITLGGLYIDYNIRKQALNFNRASDEYRIVLKDYSADIDYSAEEGSGNSYADVIKRLNNDIASGNVPDLLICNPELPFESYAGKGLFEDLYKRMDSDETGEVGRDKFEANVLKAYETNGKLYRIVPNFSVITLVAKSEFVEKYKGNFTMDKFMELADSLPEGVAMFQDVTRENMLTTFVSCMYNDFIGDGGKCNFNDGRYAKILEFVKNLSDKSVWDTIDWDNVDDNFWQDYDRVYEDGKVVMNQDYLYNFSAIADVIKNTFRTKDITVIGYPSSSGGSAVIQQDANAIAISAKSKHKDGAWDFVKTLISKEYQDKTSYNFPIRTESLEAMMANEVKTAKENYDRWNNNGNDGDIVIDGGMMRKYAGIARTGNGDENLIPYLTEEYAQMVLDCIRSADMLWKYDESMNTIIKEEAQKFFDGQCTAEAAATATQSRVSIYIGEKNA